MLLFSHFVFCMFSERHKHSRDSKTRILLPLCIDSFSIDMSATCFRRTIDCFHRSAAALLPGQVNQVKTYLWSINSHHIWHLKNNHSGAAGVLSSLLLSHTAHLQLVRASKQLVFQRSRASELRRCFFSFFSKVLGGQLFLSGQAHNWPVFLKDRKCMKYSKRGQIVEATCV